MNRAQRAAMIAVDTSALVAILWRQPEAKALREWLAAAQGRALAAGSLLELQLLLAGARMQGRRFRAHHLSAGEDSKGG
ncbi:MAG: hypothetical protein ACREHV_17205 [Rhizomicrobium sp.]